MAQSRVAERPQLCHDASPPGAPLSSYRRSPAPTGAGVEGWQLGGISAPDDVDASPRRGEFDTAMSETRKDQSPTSISCARVTFWETLFADAPIGYK